MPDCNNDSHYHCSQRLGYKYCPDCGQQLLGDSPSDAVDCSVIFFRQSPTFWWEPKEDITPYELAKCQMMFVAGSRNHTDLQVIYDEMPEGAKRHWRVSNPQNDLNAAAGSEIQAKDQ